VECCEVEAEQLETASTRTTKSSRVRTCRKSSGWIRTVCQRFTGTPFCHEIRSGRDASFPHPLTVAGDLSTTGGNSTPMSTENMLYKRCGILDSGTRKRYQIDPISANIPGVSPTGRGASSAPWSSSGLRMAKPWTARGARANVNGRSGTLALVRVAQARLHPREVEP
jgi:hypothetical protein